METGMLLLRGYGPRQASEHRENSEKNEPTFLHEYLDGGEWRVLEANLSSLRRHRCNWTIFTAESGFPELRFNAADAPALGLSIARES
jgi:hypothetical protein